MTRVLLVDDEIWQVRGLQQMIPWEEYGCEICAVAYDGVAALETAQRERPDLIFLDIQMPGRSGLEVLRQLRQTLPGARVVILSGYAEFAYAQKAVKYGASDYLLKPLDELDLLETLRRLGVSPRQAGERRESPGVVARRAVEYVDEHFREPELSVEQLARRFFVSPVYFGQLFKKQAGAPFTEYVNRKRIDCAERLLRAGEHTIAEVSELVGIPDYFYFSKLYKKFKGVPPGKAKLNETE